MPQNIVAIANSRITSSLYAIGFPLLAGPAEAVSTMPADPSLLTDRGTLPANRQANIDLSQFPPRSDDPRLGLRAIPPSQLSKRRFKVGKHSELDRRWASRPARDRGAVPVEPGRGPDFLLYGARLLRVCRPVHLPPDRGAHRTGPDLLTQLH